MPDSQRFHQLVLLWITDPPTFGRYVAALGPVVARYGGAADHVYTPTAIHAAGLDLPDVVNLVHYDDESAYRKFTADPDFLAIKPLRDNSVRMLSFDGTLEISAPSPDPQEQRVIDIAASSLGPAPANSGRDRNPGHSSARTEYLLRVTGHPDEHPADLVRISSLPDPLTPSASGASS